MAPAGCAERERETARELELELERRLRDRQNGTERRFDECASDGFCCRDLRDRDTFWKVTNASCSATDAKKSLTAF